MPPSEIEYRLDPAPTDVELARIWPGAWGRTGVPVLSKWPQWTAAAP